MRLGILLGMLALVLVLVFVTTRIRGPQEPQDEASAHAGDQDGEITPVGLPAPETGDPRVELGPFESTPLDPRIEGPLKVGILHSLSGPLSLEEAALADMVTMAVAELNEQGGVLGHQVEIEREDAKSNWPLFAQGAETLLSEQHVAAIFGTYASIARRSALSRVEPLGGLLFYPGGYEGEESSYNAFYCGSVPNQLGLAAADYLLSPAGGNHRHIVLLGSDAIYPRTTNRILRHYLQSKGIHGQSIREQHVPLGHMDFDQVVDDLIRFASGRRVAVILTLEGDSNAFFFQALADRGVQPSHLTVLSLTLDEESMRDMDATPMVGFLAASNYFMSVRSEENQRFLQRWQQYVTQSGSESDPLGRPVNAAMEASYVAVRLWAQAVAQAGTTDVDAVRQALAGQELVAPSGYIVRMDRRNHHLHKPLFIGKIRRDGQFNILWQSPSAIAAKPYSQYIPGGEKRHADWTYPYVCGACQTPRFPEQPLANSKPQERATLPTPNLISQ